jgi:hypothetical protein
MLALGSSAGLEAPWCGYAARSNVAPDSAVSDETARTDKRIEIATTLRSSLITASESSRRANNPAPSMLIDPKFDSPWPVAGVALAVGGPDQAGGKSCSAFTVACSVA